MSSWQINNLENITVRDAVFQRVLRTISQLVSARLKGEAKILFDAIPQLHIAAADNYFLHYSLFPMLRSKNPDQLLDKVLGFQREYMKSEDYSRARAITTHSYVFSTIHSVVLTKKLVEQLLEELKRRIPEEQLQQLLRQVQQAQAQQAQAQQAQAAQQAQQAQAAQQAQQAAQAQQVLQYLSSAAAAALNKNIFDEALRAAEKAAGTARDLYQLTGGRWAGSEHDELRELLDLTELVLGVDANTVSSLASKAGLVISRAKEAVANMPFFTKKRKERDRVGDEIAGYTLTRNIDRALPRELALPEELFEAKLASGGLLAREKLVVKEGAVYVLLDKSGSMEGEKTVWARSVALALLTLARRKGARFFLRFFDSGVHELVDDKNPARLARLLLTVAPGGGTNIDLAIRAALRDLKERGLSKLTNTIVIITDGEDKVTVARSELLASNAHLISVMVKGWNESLRAISDKYLTAELTTQGTLRVVEAAR